MKTAISLPDELFHEIDECARELKMTRSGLLAQAAREFVAKRRVGENPTEAWNRVLAKAEQADGDLSATPVVNKSKRTIRSSGDW